MKGNDLEKLAYDIKQRFDHSVAALDGHTLSRISQARNKALQSQGKQGREFMFWIPASALASVVVALLVYNTVPQKPVEPQTFIDEIDIISDLDLYENLEFYEWLEMHELPS